MRSTVRTTIGRSKITGKLKRNERNDHGQNFQLRRDYQRNPIRVLTFSVCTRDNLEKRKSQQCGRFQQNRTDADPGTVCWLFALFWWWCRRDRVTLKGPKGKWINYLEKTWKTRNWARGGMHGKEASVLESDHMYFELRLGAANIVSLWLCDRIIGLKSKESINTFMR